ncbi:major intracellular serine protease [Fusarium napiforme]|uniref:Major intracellular serine protease n=1 Tax=Fusarium napiforme TaxID=42672 RepID=A0A8H5IVH0_9HYPO|nr:major intracellular serine protease [Fusarium napiforme]
MDLEKKNPENLQQQQEHDSDDDDDYDIDFAVTSAFEPEDPIKKQFDLELKSARDLSLRHQDPKGDKEQKKHEKNEFIKEKESKWSEKTREERNFLHYLAEYNPMDYENPVSLQWLMKQAVQKLPVESVWLRDNKNHFPLTTALLKANMIFYYSFCLRMDQGTCQTYKTFLLNKYDDGNGSEETTCIHAAVALVFENGDKRENAFKSMCGFIPRHVFLIKDSKDRTPLHRAVEYELCCMTQVSVVSDLLRTCPDLSDVQIKDPDNQSRTLSDSASKDLKGAAPKRVDFKQEKGLDPKKDAKRVSTKTEKSSSEKTSMGPPPAREKGDAGSGLRRRDSIAITPKGMMTPSQSPLLTPVSRVKTEAVPKLTRPAVVNKTVTSEKEAEEAANKISELLKLEILRRESPENASESLRLLDEPVKDFWFDFGPPPPHTVSEDAFKRHFSHLQFDKALQYVAFPQVRPDDGLERPDMRNQGRKDMVFFFNWLRGKSVRRIIKVVVEDMAKPSHSDEAIEDCLKDFGVEILDWRRLDLDALCLQKIGGHLREVHLRWSGSNSTLRAWSEKEGLAFIPTLQRIYLFQDEGLESRERTPKNLDAFERRLHDYWPQGRDKPKVIRPMTGGGRRVTKVQAKDPKPEPRERSIDPHRWITCMEGFSRQFKQIQALRDKSPSLKPVEVALIDDSVDIMHRDLNDTKDRTFLGKSFDFSNGGSTPRVPPYWSSSSGHGTLMARLIHKICPSAVIHVIKLQTFWVGNSDKLQIRADSAVKAIEYAAKRGSQIICMSWTIKPPEGELKGEFRSAALNAIDKHHVLIFCAASDQGQFKDRSYPHGSNGECFRIGAAKATGKVDEKVGDSDTVDFILPGHEVVVNYGEIKPQLDSFEAHSGSSVANGLATGLAALIIECVRLGAIFNRELEKMKVEEAFKYKAPFIDQEDLKRIQDPTRMAYALSSIGTDLNTKNKYIEVWKTFSDVADELSRCGTSLDQLELIARLAGGFLKRGT